jgi:hypothetical protein
MSTTPVLESPAIGQALLLFRPDPASILKIAWSISGKYASEPEEQVTAQSAELCFKTIKDLLLSKNDSLLTQYAFSIESSLLACSRTFAIITRHRDYLFSTVEDRKTNEMDMYKSLQSFSAKLQSLTPRLAVTVIAGTSLPLAISETFAFLNIGSVPIPNNVMTLAVTAFGALGYLIAEIGSSRIANKKMIETKEKYESQKEGIYQEFLERSKLALTYLLDDILLNYRKIVDSNYIITEEEKKELIDNCIGSAMPIKKNK